MTTYSSGTAAHPLRVPNFAAFDEAGALYVTDSGEWGEDDGLLFRVSRDGETTVWTDAVPAFPNGCCLSAEGDALLVVESGGRRVVRVPSRRTARAPDHRGGRPHRVTARRHRAGRRRHDVRRLLPPRPHLPRPARRPPRDLGRRPLRRDPEPAREPGLRWAGPGRLLVTSLGGWNLVTADPGVAGLPLRYPTF